MNIDDQVSDQIRNPATNPVYYLHEWEIANQVNNKVNNKIYWQVAEPVRNQVNRTKNAITAPDLRQVFMAFSITKETII